MKTIESPELKTNQLDLTGFSVFELFDQLAEYYDTLLFIADHDRSAGPGTMTEDHRFRLLKRKRGNRRTVT